MKLLSMTGALAGLSLLAGASSGPKGGPCGWLASDLIGMKVISQQGDSLGKVEDVVVHPGGEASYAVLSFGGTLGMGDKLFAMPWSVLRTIEPDTAKKDSTRSLVLPLEKDRLKTAPGFDKKNWPIMANADWTKDVDAFYIGGANPNAKKPVEASTRTSVITWRVSELKGANVETPTGDKLGDLGEVAIDTNGRVCFVTLSVGGFLGMGEKHVAIPWDALKFSVGGDKGDKRMISLPVTKKQLEEAPEYTKNKDGDKEMCDPKWIGRVYEYYSVPMYWSSMDSVETKPKN
ncbi:MAG: PRC-barrel domain-containing protein [Planctomycetes bacterium]|nr:PRC-barrel domain-containing protein [Planctomycetota bacterium]